MPPEEWDVKVKAAIEEISSELNVHNGLVELAKLIDEANAECCGCGWASTLSGYILDGIDRSQL